MTTGVKTNELYALTLSRSRGASGPGGWGWKVKEIVRGEIETEKVCDSLQEALGHMSELSFKRALRAGRSANSGSSSGSSGNTPWDDSDGNAESGEEESK